MKIELVGSDSDCESDDQSTHQSDIQQSSSEEHLIQMTRHSQPVVLLRRMNLGSYTDRYFACLFLYTYYMSLQLSKFLSFVTLDV